MMNGSLEQNQMQAAKIFKDSEDSCYQVINGQSLYQCMLSLNILNVIPGVLLYTLVCRNKKVIATGSWKGPSCILYKSFQNWDEKTNAKIVFILIKMRCWWTHPLHYALGLRVSITV